MWVEVTTSGVHGIHGVPSIPCYFHTFSIVYLQNFHTVSKHSFLAISMAIKASYVCKIKIFRLECSGVAKGGPGRAHTRPTI